jgi:hypothetical protein
MEFIKRKLQTFTSVSSSPNTSNVGFTPGSDDQGMEPQHRVEIPQSGLERAEWFARNDPNLDKVQQLGLCSGGMAAIGANQRGFQGVEREDAFASLVMSRHNYAEFPDPATLTAMDSAKIWTTQVTASNGFVDGDKEVYVNQDIQTIWS